MIVQTYTEDINTSLKNSIIFDSDFVPKLIDGADNDELYLIIESMDERVLIPFYVSDKQAAIAIIAKCFEELAEVAKSDEET